MRTIHRLILSFIVITSGILFVYTSSAFSFFGFGSSSSVTTTSTQVQVDPPSRVARLSYVQGEVSFSPAAAKDNVWVVGRVNRPLVPGDRIWVDTNARAELQLGSAAVRIDDKTSVRIINLNDQIAQFDLSQGSLILHVRQLKPGQTYEIDTPQLAFRVTQQGDYRVDVTDAGDATIITIRKGTGFAYAKKAAYKITALHTYRFVGKNLQAQSLALAQLDSFDKWSLQRDLRTVKSRSINYVSPTVIGYEDLDNYGNWSYTVEYGYVWSPYRVPRGWAPYRYGHWSWIDPWGWTWIDDQPWGFAPSHYGRWAHYRNVWVWIPGSRTAQASYAPALVVFIGGGNSNNTAWFPLGPQDVYVPPYKVSKRYFNNINITNTRLNQRQIIDIYNHRTHQSRYNNYQIDNAITAVPTKSFQSGSTANSPTPVTVTPVTSTPSPVTVTPVAPPSSTVSTGYEVTSSKPSESTLERVPVVVTAPPVTTVPVEQVTAPAETSIPVVSTGSQPSSSSSQGSQVTGTYNGGDSTTSGVSSNSSAPTAPVTPTTSTGSSVTGTYNGGESSVVTVDEAKAKADKEAADAKAKADQEAADKAKADEKAAAEKAEADKAAANAEAEKAAAAAQEEAKRQAAEQAEAAKAAAAAQEEANRQAAEKAEADKAAAAAQEEAKRQAAEQAEAQRQAAEAQQRQAAEAEKAAAQAAEAQRQAAEAEKAAAAKAEADRQAAEKAEADKAAAAAQAQQQAADAAAAAAAAAAQQAPPPAEPQQ